VGNDVRGCCESRETYPASRLANPAKHGSDGAGSNRGRTPTETRAGASRNTLGGDAMTPQTLPKYSEPLREIVNVLPRNWKKKGRGSRVVLECGHEIEISSSRLPRRTRCYLCGREALAAARAALTCEHGVFPKERCIECQCARLRAELYDLAERATELEAWCERLGKDMKPLYFVFGLPWEYPWTDEAEQ